MKNLLDLTCPILRALFSSINLFLLYSINLFLFIHQRRIAVAKKKKKRTIGKVFMHNNLVEAHYTNLGALELKLLVVVAFFFQHQQSQQIIQTNFVSFDIEELADYLRIERNNFPYLRQRIRNIQSAFISYENEQEQWEQDIPLFEPPKYHYHKDGEKKQLYRVDFQIHEKLIPYFLDLGKKGESLIGNPTNKTRPFTQIEGSSALDFSSKYTLPLYFVLKKIENQTFKLVSYSLNELQAIVGSKYPTWQKFRDNVLDVSFKEINEISEIWCEYTPKHEESTGQRGRPKVIGVTFKMGMKEAYKNKREAFQKLQKFRATRKEIEGES